MKKIKVTYTKTFDLEFDVNSDTFNNAFSDYKDTIYKKGSKTNMLHHVSSSIISRGKGKMVEGVGFLHDDCAEGMFSGITVLDEKEEINILW